MAIKPAIKYPGKTNPASPAYPLGEARDITTPGDGTGTPLQKDWVNDIWGFLQAVLAEGGVTASGSPDTAQVSQYLAGLKSHSARFYATRAALTGNASAQYVNGQTIEVAGAKWTVTTGTANGMDILQLPGGKVAVYNPDRGIVYAAALGYGGADSTAVFNRCLELGQTIVLPAGVATTLQPATIPDGYSVITDTPGTITQINISGATAEGTFKLDGVNITLRDLRFNGAGRAIGAIAPISNFKASGLEFVGCLRSIWFGAQPTSGVQLDSITMTNCAEGIEGSDIDGMVVTRLTANADSVGSNFAVSAAIGGGYIQWNSHNARVYVATGSNVTLVPGVLEADSVLNVLTVAAGATVQVLCPPVLAGSAAVDISAGATANGFIGADHWVETAGYSRNHANRIEDVAVGEASYYSDAAVRLKAGAGGGEVLIAPSGTTIAGSVRVGDSGSFVWVGNTAPATPTSAGVSGQVVMSGSYIYRCIADNSWVRYSGATW